MYDKIKSYIDDGIEEDLIIQVLKISSKKVNSNPSNYITAILNGLINRNIFTLEDFYEKEENYDGQVPGNYRKKEKRIQKREDLEELYRKGYR